MKIILTAVEESLAAMWDRFFDGVNFVEVHKGSIFDVDCDAVVSPANSFGFMDGGIDLLYSEFFGWHVQDELQKLIRSNHHGELVVGNAEIVATNHDKIPYLIAAPTMRVPMILQPDSVNPYLATKAVLNLVKHRLPSSMANLIQTIAFPGMGTGCGRVRPIICAHQMRSAIAEVFEWQDFPMSWKAAQNRHQKLYRSVVTDLQFEA